jgi:hypothetical protein
MGRQAAHNQVLHLAAEGMAMRGNSFLAGAGEVCSALEAGRRPTHQLKMTRKSLRSIAEKRWVVVLVCCAVRWCGVVCCCVLWCVVCFALL